VFATEGLLLSRFDVTRLTSDTLEAEVVGEQFDPGRHVFKSELKAATYHDLVVDRVEGVWLVRVIFDT